MIGETFTNTLPPPARRKKKSLCMRMASCVFANVVVITIAGILYRSVRRIVHIGRRGMRTATTTAGGRKTGTSAIATFVEIEPDGYQSNSEKIDDTLV